MTVRKIALLLFVVLLLCIGPVSALTEIRAEGGSLAAGTPAWFNVTAGGLQNVTAMQVILEWNPQYVVVDDIAVNDSVPGLAIVTGPPMQSITYACNKEGHAIINLNASMLNQSDLVPILFVYARPTDATGTSPFNVNGFITTAGQQAPPPCPTFPFCPPQQGGSPFNITVNGTISTSAGGVPAGMGQIVFPSGTVERGSTAIVPLYLGGITNPMNFSAAFMGMDPSFIGISDITVNGSISPTPTLVTGSDPFGRSWGADVSYSPGITQDPLHGYLDLNFAANASGAVNQIEFPASYSALYRLMPSNGFRVTYPFASEINGTITITGAIPPSPPPSPSGGGGGGSGLWFPSGFLNIGEKKQFPVRAANLTNVNEVRINMVFDTSQIVIDNVSVNSSITGLSIDPYSFIRNFGFHSNPQYGEASITLTHPSAFTVTSPPSPLLNLTIRASGDGGWVYLNATEAYWNGSSFNTIQTYNGSLYSSGGMYLGEGAALILPSGSVPADEEKIFQIAVNNVTNAYNFSFLMVRTDPAINISGVKLSDGLKGTINWYGDIGGGWIYGNLQDAFTAETTALPLLDITIKANGTVGESDLIFPPMEPPSWSRYPGYTISYPFKHLENGTITIGSAGPRPVPQFTANTTNGQAPLAVGFDAGASDAIGATSYVWNFGEGAPVNSFPSLTTSHAYNAAGGYTVSLNITNASGSGTSTRTNYITVTPAPPTTIIAPNGSVAGGQQVTLPVLVANLTDVHGIGFNLTYDPLLLHVDDVVTSTEFAEATSLYYDASHPAGVLRVGIYRASNSSPLLNISAGSTPVSLADITFTANTTAGSSGLGFIANTEWSKNPIIENDPHDFEIMSGQNIIVTPKPKPDLTMTLLFAPYFVKKENDGSLLFEAGFRVDNIGNAPSETFKIEGEFIGNKANFSESESIPPGGNLTYYWNVSVVPGYPDRDLHPFYYDTTPAPYIINYTLKVGGDVGTGKYKINMTVDPYNDIEEIDEFNNRVSQNTDVTRPDLVALISTELFQAIPNSNTSYIQMDVIPGTYRVNYGVVNRGNVSINPTHLNISVNGVNKTPPNPVAVPALAPQESWSANFTVNINQYTGPQTYAVFANYDRLQKELNDAYGDDNNSTSLSPFPAVMLAMSQVMGASDQDSYVLITFTNISASSPVTNLSIPFVYDPTVCTIVGNTTLPGVSLKTPSYGRVTIYGDNLNIASNNTEIANITLRARDDSGRSSPLTTMKTAYVKTASTRYLEFNVRNGSFQQINQTDATVEVFTPPRGRIGANQSISVTISNLKTAPVTVQANVTIGNSTILREEWSRSISLGDHQSKSYTIGTWKPEYGDIYWVNATITGDDKTDNNKASRQITIEDYQLNITDTNKLYWNSYYGYNLTGFYNNWFFVGTYYSASQAGMVNGTVRIWYENWTPVDLGNANTFEFYSWTPPFEQWYGYTSDWNYMSWWIIPKKLGSYHYSITLDSRGEITSVNGTMNVREPYVDIKVVNATTMTTQDSAEIPFAIFNRTPSEQREATLSLAAGAEGRALQGLEYLIGYPHGCPEQTNSPALAALRVKQYYEKIGALNDDRNNTFRQVMQGAIERMRATDGYNAQQLAEYAGTYGDGSGGWAWGKWSTPSMFYTLYPTYVYSELVQDNDPLFWNVSYNNHQIDLNASTHWLIQRQQADGSWHDWGYISDDVQWTGFMMQTFANEYDGLNVTMKAEVDTSMQKALSYLTTVHTNWGTDSAQTMAYGIFGLKAIRDHGVGDQAMINDNISRIQPLLFNANQTRADGSKFWDSAWWNNDEATAHAVLALNQSGIPSSDETLQAGVKGLVSRYYSGGGWGSTRTSAAVINTLTQVQLIQTPNFNVQVSIQNPDGTTIYGPVTATFDSTTFIFQHALTGAEVNQLYAYTGSPETSKVVVTGKSDAGGANARLIVAIDTKEKVPKSVADASIPAQYIDPIATNFSLSVTIPNTAQNLTQGGEREVEFTMNNFVNSTDQTVMILEIPVGGSVNFTGTANAADKAYYINGTGYRRNLTHMFNETSGKLYVYPGSDDESKPSITVGEIKTFRVPLKFVTNGNTSVEARIYPMYNDQWMAIGSDTTYVKAFGNITMSAVDQNGGAVIATFYVDDMVTPVDSGISSTYKTILEGSYPFAIRNGTSWVNGSVTIQPGDTTSYMAQFVTERAIPHITTVVGATDEVTIMSPSIVDTVSNSSSNHWNAVTLALKSFNSSIASSGGIATIEINLPTVSRAIGTTYLNDSILVSVHSVSNLTTPWLNYTSYSTVHGSSLTVTNVDLADFDMINITFKGRLLGDVDGNGRLRLVDALDLADSLIGQYTMTGNAVIYGDVDDNGRIRLLDALNIADRLIGQLDDNYQTG